MTQPTNQYGRRSTQVKGFVNFPVHQENGNEGGTFVRLVVVPPEVELPSDSAPEDSAEYVKYHTDKPVVCCGGVIDFHYDECFIATDEDDCIPWWKQTVEQTVAGATARDGFEVRHFPDINGPTPTTEHGWANKYRSTSYLAVILMGSTGWNGRFHCTYADLTDEGKALYDSVQKLYPNSQLVLQTWLDT